MRVLPDVPRARSGFGERHRAHRSRGGGQDDIVAIGLERGHHGTRTGQLGVLHRGRLGRHQGFGDETGPVSRESSYIAVYFFFLLCNIDDVCSSSL